VISSMMGEPVTLSREETEQQSLLLIHEACIKQQLTTPRAQTHTAFGACGRISAGGRDEDRAHGCWRGVKWLAVALATEGITLRP
jgi:hypothetical protein